MKIMITGSEGYIGRVVYHNIKNYLRDINITCVDFDSTIKPRVDLIQDDICNITNKRYDVLIHLAAAASTTEGEEISHYYYNNNCSKYHELLKSNEFKSVIYASSYAIYDDNGEINPQMVYGDTKLVGEYITKRYTDNHTILRFANPVGAYEYHREIINKLTSGYPNVFWSMARAEVFNDIFHIHNLPGMMRSFYPVDWILTAIVKSIENSIFGTYNIAPITDIEVIPFLITLCNKHHIKYDMINPPVGVTIGGKVNNIRYHPSIESNQKQLDSEHILKLFDNYISILSDV